MLKEKSSQLTEALLKTIETQNIEHALPLFLSSLDSGGKILVCGNGGSAAQSQHFAAELVVRFKKNRTALPSISLTTDTSTLTACANDFSFDEVFSRQVEALALQHDCLLCLSTSGNSPNIIKAAQKAHEKNCKVISLTGIKENQLEKISDLTIKAQSEDTARIQEIHLFLIHFFAERIDEFYHNKVF